MEEQTTETRSLEERIEDLEDIVDFLSEHSKQQDKTISILMRHKHAHRFMLKDKEK